ncbi:H/ACA ribonucleoprotein complex subunit NOP10 [Thermoproteus tenax]|uniref:Ribosome biogenesis protein Nop10 n=1 Tax=Thermoproteus tenax (strain ATCC 35583 / DSM 2078 / JCM 9277 / NBRC 100435 / Kra 1) TaxID=768679 RepID=G4RNP2_THETK|nr:RNA-protein complex protein Nop10 [Thermoproteus tenax]CCC81186.1 ribosome biogenesis protein Nop10 [Thermoproteus tenax Kra 1]
MRSLLMRCTRCGAYTLRKDVCPKCGGLWSAPSTEVQPEDKYQVYRIKMRVMAGEIKVSEETKRKLLGEAQSTT